MLGTPRIHVHPMIIFLRGSLFLVPILSFPRRSVTFSLSNTKQARWEQAASRRSSRDLPCLDAIALVPFPVFPFVIYLCFVFYRMDPILISVLFPFHGRVNQGGFYCSFVIRLLKSHQV